jgi:hypothetical protein
MYTGACRAWFIARQSGPGHPNANAVRIERVDSVEIRRLDETNDMVDGVTEWD